MTQLSVSDIFASVKDAEKANINILEILDKHGTPKNSEEIKQTASEIADMLSNMAYEIENADRTIGVDLQFIGDKPKFALYDIPKEGGCQTCG